MEFNKRGIQAVEEVLEVCQLARDLQPEKHEAIEKIYSKVETLMKELASLQAKGEVWFIVNCVCVCVCVCACVCVCMCVEMFT